MSDELMDLERICKECNKSFTVTAGEQQHLISIFGADYRPPTRCKDCRRKRKQSNNTGNEYRAD